MYIPKHFEKTDIPEIHGLIEQYPFGAWVMSGSAGLNANHVPFLIDRTRGEFGTLVAHVARANSIWKQCDSSTEALVIFKGPQSYITPSWYASKRVNGMVVPTWNYCVVHAYGVPRAIEDKDWLRSHVSQLSSVHESPQASPWTLADAPSEFIDKLLNVIVGIEIPISRVLGKWKLSQNRPAADKASLVEGLRAAGDHSMAEWVEQYR